MDCPIAKSTKIIGTRPRILILWTLYQAENSFNSIKNSTNLTSRSLSLNLKFLQNEEIISVRKKGVKKLYSLTKKGKELSGMLEEIKNWGIKWKY